MKLLQYGVYFACASALIIGAAQAGERLCLDSQYKYVTKVAEHNTVLLQSADGKAPQALSVKTSCYHLNLTDRVGLGPSPNCVLVDGAIGVTTADGNRQACTVLGVSRVNTGN